jgi:MFS family permease
VTVARRFGTRTFAALAIPNYLRYYAGQAVSLVGTWMQTIAMGWLLLTLTGSGAALGALIAVQTLPVLLLGPYGGVVADRVDKRRLMMLVQAGLGAVALVIGTLTATGAVQVWHVFVLAGVLGLLTVFDNPARQSFVLEMVGPDDLRNAVTLNSVLVNAARAVGPAAAGILIATVGVSACFLLNAVSYVAVIVSLATLEVAALQPSEPTPRAPGQLREGLRYVRATPALAIPLGMMALIGTLAYEFQVVLPIVARGTFGGGPETYGFLTAAMGAGAVVGGLIVAGSGRTGIRAIIIAATAFGVAILLAAAAPDLTLELVALTLVGACSVTFIAIGNTTLQLATRPDMRGRVMSLWAVAFLGTTPLGGPIAGFVAEQFGGRAGLVLGGTACLLAAGMGVLALRRARVLVPSA